MRPRLSQTKTVIISDGPEQTQEIGKALGRHAEPGHVYLLVGELGVGKTCLTQGVLWGLGSSEFARSPTFVLVSKYQGRLTLNHVDLYRVGSDAEAVDLGLDDVMEGGGLTVVEWADRANHLQATEHLEVRMDHVGENTRRLTLSTRWQTYEPVVSAAESAASQVH